MSDHKVQTPPGKGFRASDAVRAAVQGLIAEVGEDRAAERLGVSRNTVARLLGGLPVQRATLAMAEMHLGLAS